MAEWLYEAGIGEARAALVENGVIIEAAIEVDDGSQRVGTVSRARLIDRLTGRVRLDTGEEALLGGTAAVTEGGALTIRVTRERITEQGRNKLAKVIVTDEAPATGPDLRARLAGAPVRQVVAHGPDLLEEAGWSEVLEEAMTGEVAFPGGALWMTPTPAMTMFDVDGGAPLEPLAVRAAVAVAHAIRRHGIGGSIGIDFPTLGGKAPRQAVAAALDAALSPPFERTTVNGFGFLQVIRPRLRASLPELLRADPLGAAACAALRRLEREPPGSPRRHRLPAGVLARIGPEWRAELTRRTGVVHVLEPA